MKKLYVILTLISILGLSPSLWAQSSKNDQQRLEQEISNLRNKIKSSRDVKSKDLQKLTELENQLQKSQFLNNNPSR